MRFERSAGILLHPTSLPGKYGIGDLGKEAYHFIDFLVKAGQKLWQIFPLGPTGYGDSPYQCFSALAGNPLLVSPDLLKEEGFLSEDDLNEIPDFNPHKIDYGNLIKYKAGLLGKAYENFREDHKDWRESFDKFCSENSDWLEDYSLFMACKEYHGGIVWRDWNDDIAFRKGNAVEEWREKLYDRINYQKFIQFLFFEQWKAVKNYAHEKGVKIIGDIPIFVAYDSADLWANKHLFSVDENGMLETVAGVPPDYFSPTGQLWGNPLYRWDEMEKNNFSWWKKRIRKIFEIVDIARIDHFRGFDAYWEIPGDAETAENGRWVKAPGDAFFTALKEEFGQLPIIAEDLGLITDGVKELRDKFEFPGMKILQFAFGDEGDKNFLPHRYLPNCVVLSGSHDNDTTRGFFEKEKNSGSGIFEWTQKYLNYYGNDVRFAVVKTAYSSVADTVVIPMQDILNLGSDARMNYPGKPDGNWQWRFTWDQVDEEIERLYKEMALMYERITK